MFENRKMGYLDGRESRSPLKEGKPAAYSSGIFRQSEVAIRISSATTRAIDSHAGVRGYVMRTGILASIFGIVAVSFSLGACGSSAIEENLQAADDDEGLSKKAAAHFVGSWTPADGSVTQVLAYHFSPDGTFFRDRKAILMGMIKPSDDGHGGAPFSGFRIGRDSGTYKVSAKGTSVTLTIKWQGSETDKETYSFSYEAGHVLMGMYKPGSQPAMFGGSLTLKMKGQADLKLERADSWCTSVADCKLEAADKTWSPMFGSTYACSQTDHSCSATNVAQ